MLAVSIKDLSVSYGSQQVFSDINIDIECGDYVALAGPNGSGKSTLIKTMLGLVSYSKGSVKLFEQQISKFIDWSYIGYIPQKLASYNPLFPCTVKEVVSMGRISSKRFPRRLDKVDEEAVNKSLQELDILNLKDSKIGNISGGQLQRVIIARAIVNNPKLLILDEPTNAIDPETRDKFFALIKRLNTDNKTTVILVTHDIGSIGMYANKLLYFDNKVIFYGTFQDFCESPNMAEYFGKGSQHLICHRHN